MEELYGDLIKDIFTKKYRNYKVYFHNFAKFDGVFLLKVFSKLTKVKPIINNGKLISLTVTHNSCTLTFNDSYLLLPSSLSKLSKSFEFKENKGIFPFKLNDINYKGKLPDLNCFNKITKKEYNKYFKDYLDEEGLPKGKT